MVEHVRNPSTWEARQLKVLSRLSYTARLYINKTTNKLCSKVSHIRVSYQEDSTTFHSNISFSFKKWKQGQHMAP